MDVLNVGRILKIEETGQISTMKVSIDTFLDKALCREPLVLEITDQRNALERTMLHFANYEKNTTKIDEDTYECLIYYNQNMETELLIEVLSFGPMLTVIGNERFLCSLKARLRRQKNCIIWPSGQ